MRRTYLRSLSMAAVIGCTAVVMPAAQSARGLFDSKAVQQNRFAVLAQPVGASNWKLLVLEQIKQRPRCWTAKADGLVDPTLNTFNFAGICSRYLDSNGYSFRSGGEDLGGRFRLSLRQRGNSLQLQVLNPRQGAPIVVGRATIPRRDRNGFVEIQLDPAWRLERRIYQGRTLNHIYFAHPAPVNRLLARAEQGSDRGFSRLGAPTPPALPRINQRLASGQPIRLEVIPYRP